MSFELHNSDCVEAMREMPEASIEAVVCDPPYGLEFMGKEWDKLDGGLPQENVWKGRHGKGGSNIGEDRDQPSNRHRVSYGSKIHGFKRCKKCGKREFSGSPCKCDEPDWVLEYAQRAPTGVIRMQRWHEQWAREAYRVLKPGGFLLAFGGTRTSHRLACAIEDAGFEIRDSIDWIYGCLSEDTEILVDGQWEPYHKALTGRLALCYDVEYDEFSWQPIEDLYVYEYDDTAFHIISDSTDQIVSRNHRCIIKRNGKWIFAQAETWEREESVPILESLSSLLRDLPLPNKGASNKKSVLRHVLRDEATAPTTSKETFIGTQGEDNPMCRMRQEGMETEFTPAPNKSPNVLQAVQRSSAWSGVGQACTQRAGCMDGGVEEIIQGKDERVEQSNVEGRSDIFPQTRELQTDQIREVSIGVSSDGAERWLCNGASPPSSAGNGQIAFTHGDCPSRKPQSTRQSVEEFGTFRQQPRPQIIRGARYTRTDLARIEPFSYIGRVWCVKVPSGAFVARRNGKIFITGNSGFPKSLDIGKAIDKAAGVEREVVRVATHAGNSERHGVGEQGSTYGDSHGGFTTHSAPATDNAKKWDGFGTALKPSHEPIVVARKPLIGTVAANVLEHGTGGINVNGCRVGTDKVQINTWDDGAKPFGGGAGHEYTGRESSGRWPPDVLLTHSENCRLIGTRKVKGDNRGDCQGKRPGGFGDVGAESGDAEPNAPVYGDDEIEAWACVEGCPVRELDQQSGNRPAGARLTGNEPRSDGMSGAVYGNGKGSRSFESYADSGGASRFFPCFRYVAKASRAEREAGCEGLSRQSASEMTGRQEGSAGLKHARSGTCPTDGARNHHPTVKPIDLMRWLVRLVTPPGGVVLDPFMGSGTTGIACHKERFGFIGIELDKDYFKIAEARIAAARAQLRLF